MNEIYEELPKHKKDRIKDKPYLYKGEIRKWNGKILLCKHKKRKSQCKECDGGCFCEHGKIKYYCKECDGVGLCKHRIKRYRCKDCDPNGYLTSIICGRIWIALKKYSSINNTNDKPTKEYIGSNIDNVRTYIQTQFSDGMTWENQGKWHIDHRRPCASFNLNNEEERHMCFHFTNLQPLWGPENGRKSDTYDPETFDYEWIDKEIGWKLK